jgi:hypothetical protein
MTRSVPAANWGKPASTSLVPSVEPSSTTMISWSRPDMAALTSASSPGRFAASFLQGMMMEIIGLADWLSDGCGIATPE